LLPLPQNNILTSTSLATAASLGVVSFFPLELKLRRGDSYKRDELTVILWAILGQGLVASCLGSQQPAASTAPRIVQCPRLPPGTPSPSCPAYPKARHSWVEGSSKLLFLNHFPYNQQREIASLYKIWKFSEKLERKKRQTQTKADQPKTAMQSFTLSHVWSRIQTGSKVNKVGQGA
jgi:hypothetical protein